MYAWESIQRALDEIEEHIDQDFSNEQLSKIANLSPFYFQRLFRRLVKRPVGEYIRLRRLARAGELLGRKDAKVLDVALSVGFNSHESFTRAFKDAYGITPHAFRSHPQWLNNFGKPDLLLQYTVVDEGVPLITDGIVIEVRRETLNRPLDYLGFTCYMPVDQIPMGENTGINDMGGMWERFHREKENNASILPGGDELGASFTGDAPEGMFTYFGGGQACPDAPPKEDWVFWQLPAGEYVVCAFEAESFAQMVNDTLYKALGYLYGTWLPAHGLATESFSVERYPPLRQDETPHMEIWVKPVQAGEPIQAK